MEVKDRCMHTVGCLCRLKSILWERPDPEDTEALRRYQRLIETSGGVNGHCPNINTSGDFWDYSAQKTCSNYKCQK